MKKFITAILLVTMLSSLMVPSFASNIDTAVDEDVLIAAELFDKLGVLQNDMSNEKMTQMMTKGDFAVALCRLLGYGGVETSNVYFEDSTYLNEVNLLVQSNIIPKSETKFNPSENITFSDAVTWLLNATGWGVKATARGGGFPNYVLEATQCGLFDMIDKSNYKANTELNTEDVIRLFYSAANIKLFAPDSFINGNPSYVASETDTILNTVFDVYTIEDRVNADRYTGIYASTSPCADGYIRVGKKDFKYKGEDYDTLIGKNVKVFYKDEPNEIVAIFEDKDANETIKISADQKPYYKNHKLTYYNEKGNDVSVSLTANTALIYNNVAVASNHESVINSIKSGFVTLYKNAKSGKYDVIVVDEYINAQITGITALHDIVYTDSSIPEAKTINCKNYAYRKYYSSDGVSTVFLAGYVPGDAVTVKMSKNNKVVILYLSKSAVSGTVKNIKKVNGTTLTIDDEQYKIAADCNLAGSITLGNEYKFATNLFGEIIAIIENRGKPQAVLAYLYGYDETDGLNNVVAIKVFTQLGEHLTYELADKVNLDGTPGVKKSDVKTTLCDVSGNVNRGLIRYIVNSKDKITMIDTPAADVNSRESDGTLWDVFGSGVTARKYVHAEDVIKPNGSLAKGFTDCFIVPSDHSITDEAHFGIMKYDGENKPLGWTGNYQVGGYKFCNDYKAIDAVVYEFNANTSLANRRVMVVDEVRQELVDEEVYNIVAGYAGSIYQIMTTQNDSLIAGVSEGDTIVVTNFPGNDSIAKLAVILDYDPVTKKVTPQWSNPDTTISGTISNVAGMMGYIKKFQRKANGASESFMRIVKGSTEHVFSFTESKQPVIIYDDGDFTFDDFSSVISAEQTNGTKNGDSIYLVGTYPYFTDAIIYKSYE